MSNLTLQERVGHRFVSTIRVKDHPWEYETIIFGGKNRNRIAHMETYRNEESARRGHEAVVADVKINPSNYNIMVKPWYERFSVVSPN